MRRSWARLIYKVYEVDPLLCPRCGASMKVIAVIEDAEVIYRILSHLNLLAQGTAHGPHPVLTRSAELTTKPVEGPPPASVGLRELTSVPISDDLPWPDPS